ncbi:MAG: tRNA-dihydrouridine synthase family protein [Spirochaetaceae bacterium]|nr:tRNA-dihydrouridine synthase family protein [Spirochaetaceae bacterium]MBR2362768.1 tRNA-dihydrouridine synthase family protein [Spirochaetaceae bacterium]
MKLILAPMATLTHAALRSTIAQFGGCDEYYTEMIQAGTLLTGGPFEKYYLFTAPEPEKIVWQITGGKIPAMVEAAKMLSQMDGIGVDINMGCCAPDIVRAGAGIAWMLKDRRETEELVEQVGAVVRGAGKRFSVKLRLGDEDFTTEGFFSFIDMLAQRGVQQVALHPRTKKEKYRRPPRLHYVGQLVKYIEEKGYAIQVVLNGGVSDGASAKKAQEQGSGISGIMIGRAAAQKPWVFKQIADYRATGQQVSSGAFTVDLLETARNFIEQLQHFQPQEFYKTRLQRFFAFYSDNVQFAHHLRTRLLNHPTPEGCLQQLEEYFAAAPHERFKEENPPHEQFNVL